jgi:hypothetical protein
LAKAKAINHIKVMIEKVAQTEAIITGPNGTEKNWLPINYTKSERANFL